MARWSKAHRSEAQQYHVHRLRVASASHIYCCYLRMIPGPLYIPIGSNHICDLLASYVVIRAADAKFGNPCCRLSLMKLSAEIWYQVIWGLSTPYNVRNQWTISATSAVWHLHWSKWVTAQERSSRSLEASSNIPQTAWVRVRFIG